MSQYTDRDADELGIIAHRGTLTAREAAISELVSRAEAIAEVEAKLREAERHMKHLSDDVARMHGVVSPSGKLSVVVALTPPVRQPSEDVTELPYRMVAAADVVVAGAIDNSYVTCLKHRWGSTDDVDIQIVWQR